MPIQQREEKKISPAAAAGFALLMLLAPASATNAVAAPSLTAEQILDRVNRNMTASDEAATVKMRIVERNGATKDRELKIQRKSKGEKRSVLVRLLAPGDIRGTGLLSVEEDGDKDQWLYLPSSKRTRKILGSKQGGSFLGSELSYEDMGGSSGVRFASKLIKIDQKNGRKIAVIESRPKKGESAYSRIISWVPLDKFVVIKANYYDKRGKLLKVAKFDKYKKFDGKTWRARKVQIKNVQNKRGTVMVLRGLRVNRGIGDDLFTKAALEEGE